MGRRILVAEDEALLALEIEDILAGLGHEVVGPVDRLDAALDLAESAAIDLALLDVNLAGEASYPVARLLRARGVPVVFATGFAWTGLDILFRGAPVLQKPFAPEALARAIETATVEA